MHHRRGLRPLGRFHHAVTAELRFRGLLFAASRFDWGVLLVWDFLLYGIMADNILFPLCLLAIGNGKNEEHREETVMGTKRVGIIHVQPVHPCQHVGDTPSLRI